MMIPADPGHGALRCDRIAVAPALSRASTSLWPQDEAASGEHCELINGALTIRQVSGMAWNALGGFSVSRKAAHSHP
jgi:hypothetical protein